MKVKRTMTIDTATFKVGDVIKFKLDDGEKVKAKAVKETPEGMLFVFDDCLAKEYQMFEVIDGMVERDFMYINSDLREALNGEIFARFPEEIRSRMVPVNRAGDMLRVPSEEEIFGENIMGKSEHKKVKQWKPMKKQKNRIAFQSRDGAWEWYWLTNRSWVFASHFVYVDSGGDVFYSRADYYCGVRPVFCLR